MKGKRGRVAVGRTRIANGIPIENIYKDRQYMQRIVKQVGRLVNTERILKEDPHEGNILSETAVKQIHDTGNYELHEVRKRTEKVQCQRCHACVEAGFKVCQCGGQLNMSEEITLSPQTST